MKAILVPGNSITNKKWIEDVEVQIKDLFEKTYVHYYKHWKTGKQLIDIEDETKILCKYLESEKEYLIIAKSVGAALAIKSIKEKEIHPKRCIFLGLPVLWCRENDIDLDSWIKGYSCPSLFIQNSNDPVIEAGELKEYLKEKGVRNYHCIEFKGNTHDYDINKLKEILRDIVND